MKIITYQAGCGDASRITFLGIDGEKHNIFIDSGFARTFKKGLQNEIEQIVKDDENIDLWIISHIHDDHIGGAHYLIKLMKNNAMPNVVKSWYYNAPRPESFQNKIQAQSGEAASIAQGDDLWDFILTSYSKSNDITNVLEPFDCHGIKITVLSPSLNSLNSLRKKYSDYSHISLEKEENPNISSATAAKSSDYHIKISDFPINDATEDLSLENGSSIAVLIDYHGSKSIWLADAHPSIVIEKLKSMGYSKSNPILCDLVKVSHHGSIANNHLALYELISCNNFLITGDGQNKYHLPSKQCLAKIIRSPYRSLNTYNFYFTHDNETLRNMFIADGNDVFEKYNFRLHFQQNYSQTLELFYI